MSFFDIFGGEGSTHKDASIIDKLKAIGGSSDRSTSGVNITAAAQRLKVNPRTVRGWVNEGRKPSPKSAKRVTTLARNAERTKSGRQAAMERARKRGTFAGVSMVNITGDQGPTKSGADYSRHRTIRFSVDGDAMDRLQQAYIDGGDEAVDAELTRQASTKYLKDWGVSSYGDGPGDSGIEWS